MNKIQIFLMRVALAVFFGVILTRFFRPEKGIVYSGAVGLLLLLAAYLFEYLGNRKK